MKFPTRLEVHRTLALLGLAASLAGCASYSPPASLVGADRQQVTQTMGKPTQAWPQSGGERWVYARGPAGFHTYFVDLDANGRVVRWEQRLKDEVFSEIVPGMRADDVVRLIGPSFEKRGLARQRGAVWSYRYDNAFCLWFEVEVARDGTVRSAGRGPRPECQGRDDLD